MKPLLGTFVEIVVFYDEKDHETAIASAFDIIHKVQNLLSFHDMESDLTKLNLSLNQKLILDRTSIIALKLAQYMTTMSSGYFNFTVGGALVHAKALPNHNFGERLLVGKADDLRLEGTYATLKKPVLITLDGIAKGLAVDLAVKSLLKSGLTSGWVNAGGDMRIFGEMKVPIFRKGHDEKINYLGEFSNTAIATSSVTSESQERFPGVIVGKPGSKIKEKPGTWTIRAPSAWIADALTKVVATAPINISEIILSKCNSQLIEVKDK